MILLNPATPAIDAVGIYHDDRALGEGLRGGEGIPKLLRVLTRGGGSVGGATGSALTGRIVAWRSDIPRSPASKINHSKINRITHGLHH
jgi:hypothetical protein